MRAVTWRKAILPLLALVLALSLAFSATSLPPPPAAAQELVELWHKVYDGGEEDRAYDVAVDSQGNIIVTGCSFVEGIGTYYTIKYDPDGNELWNETWAFGSSIAFGVAVDSNDNVIVTGGTVITGGVGFYTIKYAPNGTLLYYVSYADIPGSYLEGRDVAVDSNDNVTFVIYDHVPMLIDNFKTYKYDADDTWLWTQPYDGGDYDEPWGIAVDSNYNVIVTGTSYHVDGYYPCTLKYDPEGNLLSGWPVFYGGGDAAYGVAVDLDDNIIVTGYNLTLSEPLMLPVYDYCTVKYDSTGTELWNVTYDAGDDDIAHGVAVDSQGNIIVSGRSSLNYYTIKYDPDGNELWSEAYDGGSTDEAWGVAVDAEGNIIVTGYSNDGSTDNYYTIKYGIAPAPPAEGGLSWPVIVGIAVGGVAAAAGIYFFTIRRWLKPGPV